MLSIGGLMLSRARMWLNSAAAMPFDGTSRAARHVLALIVSIDVTGLEERSRALRFH